MVNSVEGIGIPACNAATKTAAFSNKWREVAACRPADFN
jgi:hypothetical protein